MPAVGPRVIVKGRRHLIALVKTWQTRNCGGTLVMLGLGEGSFLFNRNIIHNVCELFLPLAPGGQGGPPQAVSDLRITDWLSDSRLL